MRRELRKAWIAVIALALCAVAAGPVRAQQPGEAQRTRPAPPAPAKAKAPPPAPKPVPAPRPAPAPAPKPGPAPPPKPNPPPPSPSQTAEDERIVRDLEFYMLYEMLNDYEIFYDDSKADKKR
jgi:outer membrane biosynthesis protein TonB